MKKYKLGVYPHLINVASIILCGTLMFLSANYPSEYILTVVFAISLIIAIFNTINIIFAYSIVDEKGLFQRSMVTKKFLSWDEIIQIKKQPAGKLLKISIGVSNGYKVINITNWTTGYISLVKHIVRECSKNKKIEIDESILELIKN